jgi:3-methylcrotonyl-CoA carboxylase alpha subunit
MEYRYQLGDEVKSVRVERAADEWVVAIDDRTYHVQAAVIRSGELSFVVDGERRRVYTAAEDATRYLSIDGAAVELRRPDSKWSRRRSGQGEDSLSASMPGQVLKVLVQAGEAVERGQALIVLEAMKMEIKVAAPHAGHVAKVHVGEGDVVDRGQLLIEVSA